jgi:hypothetical protein
MESRLFINGKNEQIILMDLLMERIFINEKNEQIILMDLLMERIFINGKKRTVKKKVNSLTVKKRSGSVD